MATVADLQRGYRALVDKIKKTGEPLVVVNNGRADVVIMDIEGYQAKAARLQELEEESLLEAGREAIEEYKAGKIKWLKKGQKISDLL